MSAKCVRSGLMYKGYMAVRNKTIGTYEFYPTGDKFPCYAFSTAGEFFSFIDMYF